MNEVTKIHLGRQAFTISVDAHHELRHYLDAIKKEVKDEDVVNEIELRMAELLSERGVNSNKVIIASDVSFLKKQLGNPNDFKEDDEDSDESDTKQTVNRRLFRDSEGAMLAGVASGLANYFGIDTLLVRILFIIFVIITAGWGILLYIGIWILVPEAKTSSERLQMVGKAVTVESLKETVEQADIKGAARRANSTLATFINTVFRVFLKVIGLLFIFSGLSAFLGLIAWETYFLLYGHNWAQYNIFPVGLREHILLDVGVAVAALISVFIVLFGIAMFRRKWPIHVWVTGILAGLIFIGFAVGGALAADVYPNVHSRYNANLHSTVRYTEQFSSINFIGDQNINFVVSDKYFISFNYYGYPNLSTVKTTVKNEVLTIDTSQFNESRNCQTICIPNSYNLVITIYSPNAQELSDEYAGGPPVPMSPIPGFIKPGYYEQN